MGVRQFKRVKTRSQENHNGRIPFSEAFFPFPGLLLRSQGSDPVIVMRIWCYIKTIPELVTVIICVLDVIEFANMLKKKYEVSCYFPLKKNHLYTALNLLKGATSRYFESFL